MQFHLHSLGIAAPCLSPTATCFLVALPAIAADMDNSSACIMPVAVAAAVAVAALAALAASGCVSLHA